MDVYYIWLLTFCVSFTSLQAQSCKNEQKCRISRIHGMKGADCYKREMRAFPQCLSSDVEIIDLSYNRIRKLNKGDLNKYSDLKMLYLADNAILSIDDETFEGKDELTTLDLSLNSLTKLPSVVFHLPSLNSLYLGQNLNMNIVESVDSAKPVTSPLVHLDFSYVMSEEANELPDLGVMPFLLKYNISGNKLMSLTTKQFAGLCQLQILDTTNVSSDYMQPCDCWTINRWLKSRKVQFKPFECEISETACLDGVPSDDLEVYTKCSEKIKIIVEKSRIKKIVIPVVVIAVVILIVIVCFVVRQRRKRKQAQEKSRAEEQMLYDNNTLLKKT